MATVTDPKRPLTLEESHGRVHSPLERLRGAIRTYIGLEGLITLFTFLGMWFWIGLVLDYGFFKAFTLDWVQLLPFWFRAGILIVLLSSLIALLTLRVAVRLTRDFRDAALALVLERRFPKLLGDRLITAVELADTREAAKLGYSPYMVEQTIHDAAARVDQVPIGEVFDWKRLIRGGVKVGLLTVGLYVVAALAFSFQPKHVSMKTSVKDWQMVWTGDGVRRLNEVSSIWFERNILLRNIIWPRRSHLELIGFPREGYVTIGRGASAPPIRVRALKWVIADSAAEEGWRALRWTDLNNVLDAPVSTDLVPASWHDQVRDPDAGLTVDEVELRLEKPDAAEAMTQEQRDGLADVISRLEKRTSQAGMARKLRMLQIPEIVYVNYKGASSKSEMTLQKSGDNEFAGEFSALNENIKFVVHGEDYYTKSKDIFVVPPPGLQKLMRDEYRPAYLYYRQPKDGKPGDLIAKKQVERDLGANVVGSDSSKITLPMGTDVVLTGEVDKDLAGPPRLIPAAKGGEQLKNEVVLLDEHHFQMRFNNVRSKLDFALEIVDTDNVTALRRVEIIPQPDSPPTVDDFRVGDMIRRTSQGYMVTPVALIPFAGLVKDDVALDGVEFAYSLVKLDKQAEQNLRGLLLLSAATMLPGGPGHELYTAATVAAVTKSTKQISPEDQAKEIRRLALAIFQKKLAEEPRYNLAEIRANLDKAPPERKLLTEFRFDQGDADTSFDLKPLGLEVPKGGADPQPRYKMQIWVEAVDNNIETGPGKSLVKERLPFIIVSEDELLSEIGKEEEGEYTKLSEVVTALKQAQTQMDTIKGDLIAANLNREAFGPMTVRVEEQETLLDKHKLAVTEVKAAYDRILRELKANRVSPDWIRRVDVDICKQLDAALTDDVGEFATTAKALQDLREILDGKEADAARKADQAKPALEIARSRTAELEKRLSDVLEKMQGIIELKRLIDQLLKIKESEENMGQRFSSLRKQLEDLFFQDDKKEPAKEPKKDK
ncbi:MAG: hypothetical protein ACJ8FY_03520 [Gemmataceae bacterium]